MKNNPNKFKAPFTLHGRWGYRLQSVFVLYWAFLATTIRRMVRGPRFPNWSWMLESSIFFTKKQASRAFNMPDMAESREYEDALIFYSSALEQVKLARVDVPVRGQWYETKTGSSRMTVLYLHGGGYAYYSKSHQNLIARVTLAAEARTFALDYSLIPEHRFPTQLDEAVAAYRWLLETGTAPENLVLAGDSAGGNLTLALLLALREAHLPFPALTVGLCPWTDLANPGESMITNGTHDWIDKQMADQWATWFCDKTNLQNPLISPVYADLRGLPPIYLQAGGAEILLDMIRTFAAQAERQGVQVKLQIYDNMPHDFQAYGEMLPESRVALKDLGEMVRTFVKLTK